MESPSTLKEYPVKLGHSFYNQSNMVWTMNYGFRPSSIDDKKRGFMKISQNISHLSLSTLGGKKVTFEGTVDEASSGECTLLFDPKQKCFILERLGKSIRNLKMKKRKLHHNGSIANTSLQTDFSNQRPTTLSSSQKMLGTAAPSMKRLISQPVIANCSVSQQKISISQLKPSSKTLNAHHNSNVRISVPATYTKPYQPTRQPQTNTTPLAKPTTLAPVKLAMPSQGVPVQKVTPLAKLAPAPQMASYGGSAELSSSDDDDDDDLFD